MFKHIQYTPRIFNQSPKIEDPEAISILIDLGLLLNNSSMIFFVEEFLLIEKICKDIYSYCVYNCSPFPVNQEPDLRTKELVFSAKVSNETIKVEFFKRGLWEEKLQKAIKKWQNEKQQLELLSVD